jgi:pyridoxal phosphate enzyme (YggS family)
VGLIAVGKGQPVAALRAAHDAGQRRFGESYLREAQAKISALAAPGIEWHFIGPIQANKTRGIAALFDWVHGVARLSIAERLNEQRPLVLAPLQVCIQVNVSSEASKSGVSLDDLPALATAVAGLPRLRLRGLMAIPAACADPATQRLPFRALREALDRLNARGLALDTLSMGMSDDFEAAIHEGATLVRIGTAVFGVRPLPATR